MAENPSNIVPDQIILLEGGSKLVPAPASSDAGKVLGVVNASGDIGWVEDQGGTLTQVQADWAETDPTKVSFIDNKPTIPSKTSDLQNDSGFITSASVPTKTSDLQNDSGFITSSALPTVNDATLTIQKNGSTIDTFTANSSTNKTVNIAVPTKTSDLQNDSGFITSSDIPAQVQANWNESDSGSASFIQNKPQNIVQDASYVHTDENFTSADKTKLSGIAAGAEVNVQSNWTENDPNSDAFISNKPSLATVATTGAYSDLSGTPTIPTVDQTYDASSTNAQSGTAVAQALGQSTTLVDGDGIVLTESNNQLTIDVDVDNSTIGIDASTKKIKLLSTIPTVPTAGNMLSVTNDVLNVTTTAGITDIQLVNAIPANPDATVLYIIPAT